MSGYERQSTISGPERILANHKPDGLEGRARRRLLIADNKSSGLLSPFTIHASTLPVISSLEFQLGRCCTVRSPDRLHRRRAEPRQAYCRASPAIYRCCCRWPRWRKILRGSDSWPRIVNAGVRRTTLQEAITVAVRRRIGWRTYRILRVAPSHHDENPSGPRRPLRRFSDTIPWQARQSSVQVRSTVGEGFSPSFPMVLPSGWARGLPGKVDLRQM